MSKREVIHIVPVEGEKDWGVKREGSSQFLKIFSNREDAIDYGKEMAEKASNGQLIIYDKDGKFQRKFIFKGVNLPTRIIGEIFSSPFKKSVIKMDRYKYSIHREGREKNE
ncbi:MAG: DUF2188 domain-containing protein [Candidatus Helarchaeota archaeon]